MENIRLLRYTEERDKKIITVGIVSERVDSYKTVIVPDGCTTPMEAVVVDYNHNRISTGAKVFDKGVQDVTIILNGNPEIIKSRVVEIHVFDDSRAWTRENKEKKPEEVGNLYDYIEMGRVAWVSVDFAPDEDFTETVYDANGVKKRVVYNKWALNYLSLLDVRAGQDDSYFADVRFLKDDKKDEISNILNKDTMETKRNYIGGAVVSATGEYAVVTGTKAEASEDGVATVTTILTKLDGTIVETGEIMDKGEWKYAPVSMLVLKLISMVTKEEVEVEDETVEAKREAEEVVVEEPNNEEVVAEVVEETVVEEVIAEGETVEELKEQVRAKELEIKKLTELQAQIQNSPQIRMGEGTAEVDGEDADPNEDKDADLRIAKQMKF
jgi:hypothetical protein